MNREVELSEPAPERRAGVFCWRFGASGAHGLFFGRGAPERDRSWPPGLIPPGLERAWLRQVHSDRVIEATPGACGEGDALLTERPRLALVVATADCVPILLAGAGAVAAVHAGWRGLAAGVVAAAVGRIGAVATAWIGPAIGPCCYEVGPEVEAAVVASSSAGASRPGPRGRPHLDLGAAAAEQLRRTGVARIVRVPVCTRCRPEWLWSHRGEGPGAGRNLSVIWRGADPS